MKKLNQFKPLWNLIKEEKVKLIVASILIFIVEIRNPVGWTLARISTLMRVSY